MNKNFIGKVLCLYSKFSFIFDVPFFAIRRTFSFILLVVLIGFRNNCVRDWVERIEKHDGGLKDFSQAYKYYGLHFQQDNSVVAREWAPGAVQVYLTGDFSKF